MTVVTVYFKVIFLNLLAGTEEKHKKLSGYLDQDLNSGPPEYETAMLNTTLYFYIST
jgi:hypothetical protein